MIRIARGEPLALSDIDALAEAEMASTFLALARFHRVDGLAYEALRSVGAQPDVLQALVSSYDASVHRHARTLWALSRAADTLGRVGCRWVVVKGPVLVECLYWGRPGTRPYFDLDLLVEPRAFGDALDAFEREGAQILDRNWAGMARSMRGEVHLRLEAGVLLDLHWNLIDMHRNAMDFRTDDLLSRLRVERIAGLGTPMPDAEDSVLHLAFHAAYSGGDRLLWLKDVQRAAEVWQPDWNVVEDRAARARIAPAVGLILERARRVLGADVPPELPLRMTGQLAARVAGLVDRVSPWQYGLGRFAAPTRILSRSIGHGPVGAATWVAARVIRNLDPWQERRTSTFTQRGDEADKRRFIQAIGAMGREVDRSHE
jgi:hypothetical protein